MSRRYRALNAAALLVALWLATAAALAHWSHVAHAETQEVVKVRVEVTDGGFRPAIIEVEGGSLVELTFVWAHQALPQDEHVIVLDGYKLESEKINIDHREATIRFVADKPGTFAFKCDLQCESHDFLQNASLKVKRGSGSSGSAGSAASFTPTDLSISASATATSGEVVTLTVVLKDAYGGPVSKAEVRFYLDAEFAGKRGQMEIGKARTDPNGVAVWAYQPTLDVPQYNITARFEGMGVYGESQEAIAIQALLPPPSAYTVAPVGLEGAPKLPTPVWLGDTAESVWSWSVSHWGPLLLTLMVVGAWATFIYVLYNLYSAMKVRS